MRGSRKILYFVIGYIVISCAWWSYLLLSKNAQAFNAKKEALQWEQQIERLQKDLSEDSETKVSERLTELFKKIEDKKEEREFDDVATLEAKRSSQTWMIIGEGSVFFLGLLGGIYFVRSAFRKEVEFAQQQKNFLLSITHELKSPIASIRIVLETFLKRTLKDEHIKRFSGNAIKEVDRLHNLVINIIMAARFDKSIDLMLGDVQIDDMTYDIVEKLRTNFPNQRFALEVDGPIPTMKLDRMAMVSVIRNLLENAVKYSPKEEVIVVDIYCKNNSLILKVADKGIGVPDIEKEKIFEKFYRIGNEDTRQTQGTGLGLSLVKQIVTAHKGSITVRDNYPQGAIFHLSIPLNLEQVGEKSPVLAEQGI